MHEVVRYSIECFEGALKKALNNKLKLHSSIQMNGPLVKDIGYIFNEQRYGNFKNIIEEKIEEGEKKTLWIGYKYMVWAKNFILWIYNDDIGDIILEITPCFQGKRIYLDSNEPLTLEEKETIAKYNQWIKNYQPILIRKVSRKIVQIWLKQTNVILETIEKNIRRENNAKRI